MVVACSSSSRNSSLPRQPAATAPFEVGPRHRLGLGRLLTRGYIAAAARGDRVRQRAAASACGGYSRSDTLRWWLTQRRLQVVQFVVVPDPILSWCGLLILLLIAVGSLPAWHRCLSFSLVLLKSSPSKFSFPCPSATFGDTSGGVSFCGGGDGGPTSRIAFKASSGDGARAAAAGPGGRAGPRRKEEWRTSRPATAERLCSAINLQHLDSPIGIREEGVRRGHDAERLRRDRGILSAPQAPVDGVPLPRPLPETADVLRAPKRGDVVRGW